MNHDTAALVRQMREALAKVHDGPLHETNSRRFAAIAAADKWLRQYLCEIVAPDCRTCRLYVGNGSPCITVAKCVDASQYKPSTPVQQWHGVA